MSLMVNRRMRVHIRPRMIAVTIEDVLGTGIGKLDPPASDEVERLVDVLKLLHPQLGSGGIAAEGLVTENLKEVYEYDLRGRQ